MKHFCHFFLVTLLFGVYNLTLTKSFCQHISSFFFPALKFLCDDLNEKNTDADWDLVRDKQRKVQQRVQQAASTDLLLRTKQGA